MLTREERLRADFSLLLERLNAAEGKLDEATRERDALLATATSAERSAGWYRQRAEHSEKERDEALAACALLRDALAGLWNDGWLESVHVDEGHADDCDCPWPKQIRAALEKAGTVLPQAPKPSEHTKDAAGYLCHGMGDDSDYLEPDTSPDCTATEHQPHCRHHKAPEPDGRPEKTQPEPGPSTVLQIARHCLKLAEANPSPATTEPTLLVYPGIAERCLEASFADVVGRYERLREDYERACKTVAEMHAAAVGEIRGPTVGTVEDVAAVRAEVLRLRAGVAMVQASAKRSGDDLSGYWVRDELMDLLDGVDIAGERVKQQARNEKAKRLREVAERLEAGEDVDP